MAPNPGAVEVRIDAFIDGWTEHAPNATFSGLTLAQFKAKVKPSVDARASIKDLGRQTDAARIARDNADPDTVEILQQVSKSVAGDPNFGEDSALYASFGYVRKSDRASGLKRASKSDSTPAPEKAKEKENAA